MTSKVIELPVAEFKKLMSRIDNYKIEISNLSKTVDYLNEEIKKYNKEFTND